MSQRILLVMPPERRERMTSFLAGSKVEVVPADGIGEAHRKLSGLTPFDLAFVDSELCDGSWRDLLQFVIASRSHCEVVVCARCGDERLWAEVIQCGAFDLVPEPMERQEVLRIMRSALDSHYLERFGRVSEARA
jgi:DNA-binding NtrC family response regulator